MKIDEIRKELIAQKETDRDVFKKGYIDKISLRVWKQKGVGIDITANRDSIFLTDKQAIAIRDWLCELYNKSK